jgi:hypothetical protein
MRRSPGAAFVLAVALGAALGACGSKDAGVVSAPSPEAGQSAAPTLDGKLVLWPAPSDPLTRASAAGLTAEDREHLAYHVHAHLDIFLDGQPVLVPAGLGINTADPEVKTFGDGDRKGYGGIATCAQACISPLHTHDPDGVLHTEADGNKPNTLGQLFTEWGIPLTADCIADRCGGVKVYVDGTQFTGDPSTIELTDHREIALVVGTPPADIPSRADFSNA